MIPEFQDEWRWLSNFWPAVVVWNGLEYPSVEHAYQAAKCVRDSDRATLRSMGAGQAKRAVRSMDQLPDFQARKREVMLDLVRQKFFNHAGLAAQLLATGTEKLQEGNRWGDQYWGVDLRTGKGRNVLGEILMQVRTELRLRDSVSNPRVVHCKREPYDVYIGRGKCPKTGKVAEWGNPFRMENEDDRTQVIAEYEEWLLKQPDLVAKAQRELRGKVLACWCAPNACHGDVLLRIANEPAGLVLAGTGHRPQKLGGFDERTYNRLLALARAALRKKEPSVVISGMALGWDTALAEAAVLEQVPFRAYVPFEGQANRWPEGSQRKYNELLERAAEVRIVSTGGFSAAAMQRRNEAMVDDCHLLVALWDGSSGGTDNCLRYAREVGRETWNLWRSWVKHATKQAV